MAASAGTVLAELRRHNLSEIARCLGVRKQAVSGWQQVPATRVRSVSEITGRRGGCVRRSSKRRRRPMLQPANSGPSA